MTGLIGASLVGLIFAVIGFRRLFFANHLIAQRLAARDGKSGVTFRHGIAFPDKPLYPGVIRLHGFALLAVLAFIAYTLSKGTGL